MSVSVDNKFDLIVIGAGPGGYVAAIKAAQLGLKVACVEKYQPLGGTCLNVGCIPSKALLQSSEVYSLTKHQAQIHGITFKDLSFDLKKMMERKQQIISSFNQGIEGLFKKNKVVRIQGRASFISKDEIEITTLAGKQTYFAKNFILATGSKPTPLPFLPFDEKQVISSTGALSLTEVPKKMIVVGAGVIGVELGSVYSRLGSEVIFLEFLDRICPTLDEAASKGFQKILEKQGLKFHLKAKVVKGERSGSGVEIHAEIDGKIEKFFSDVALVAIGRKPYTEGLELEKIGVKQDAKGFVIVDSFFRTSNPSILAIGDIIDGPMLAHKAEEEGIAAAEYLAGHSAKVEYMMIPNVVYTTPEVAAVGLTEQQAKDLGIQIKTSMFPFKANSRARCMAEEEGFVKIVARSEDLRILGVHIVGPHAGELISEAVVAMQNKMSAKDLSSTFHAHPTLSEAIKESAMMIGSKAIHL